MLSSGVVTTLAGGSAAGNADGVGTAASFNNPLGIAFDGVGTLFVTDEINQRIRRIVVSTATVSTLAGSTNGFVDAIGTAAQFWGPYGMIHDGSGTLYVAERINNAVRAVAVSSATVTTLVGSTAGYQDGTGTAALFRAPCGVFFSSGTLYVADMDNSRIRQVVVSTRVVTTVTITGGVALATPFGVTSDGAGKLYVMDTGVNRVVQVTLAGGAARVIVGGASVGGADGAGTSASFNTPMSAVWSNNGLYVTDYASNKIRRVEPR